MCPPQTVEREAIGKTATGKNPQNVPCQKRQNVFLKETFVFWMSVPPET